MRLDREAQMINFEHLITMDGAHELCSRRHFLSWHSEGPTKSVAPPPIKEDSPQFQEPIHDSSQSSLSISLCYDGR
nr:hypothetical protein Q903MT_gene1188 [Picea sitchensis]